MEDQISITADIPHSATGQSAKKMVGSYHVTAKISPKEYLPYSNENAWIAGIYSQFQVPNNPETGRRDLLFCLGLQSEVDLPHLIQTVLTWEEGNNGYAWFIFTRYSYDDANFIESPRTQVKPGEMLSVAIDYISIENDVYKYIVKFDGYESQVGLEVKMPSALNMPVVNFEPYTKNYQDFPPNSGFLYSSLQVVLTSTCDFAKQVLPLDWKFQKLNVTTPSGNNGEILVNEAYPEWPSNYSVIRFNFR